MASLHKLNLSAEHRELLQALFQEIVPEAEVWAYGSRVKEGSHPGSDLDLVLKLPSGEVPAVALNQLRQRLEESALPMLVDVHDWQRLPPAFQNEITLCHVCLTAATSP